MSRYFNLSQVSLWPNGLVNYFVYKRFAVQIFLWLLEFVIQINLEHDTIAIIYNLNKNAISNDTNRVSIPNVNSKSSSISATNKNNNNDNNNNNNNNNNRNNNNNNNNNNSNNNTLNASFNNDSKNKYALVIARFRVQYDQYFPTFSYFAEKNPTINLFLQLIIKFYF